MYKRLLTLTLCMLLTVLCGLPVNAAVFYEDGYQLYEPDEVSADTESFTPSDGLPVTVRAKAAVLMDVTSGKVLLEKDAHTKLYPASVTKVMSMLLIAEAIDNGELKLTDEITASTNASSKGGSQIWLKEGETMTAEELKEYVYSHMASHKVPKYVDFMAQFPMNAAGKVLKYKMRENAIIKYGLKSPQ